MRYTKCLLYDNPPTKIAICFEKYHLSSTIIAIVIAFYSPNCLGQKTVKGSFGVRVKLQPVYHTRWRFQTVPLIAKRQVAGKL